MLAGRSNDGHSKSMTEKKELMRVEEGSELARIDALASHLVSEFSEEGWGTHYDESVARWRSEDEVMEVRLEHVFSYTSNEAWGEYHLRELPQRGETPTPGWQKTLVVSTAKDVDGRPQVAEVREYQGLRWGLSDWDGVGPRQDRAPTEYDLMEFDIYLTAMRLDKERTPKWPTREAARRELGPRALREASLDTTDLEFFLAESE